MLALLQYQRESVVRKVTGISEASARRQFVRTGTTLLWIVKHLSHAEILWLDVRFAGSDVENPSDVVTGDDSIGAAIEAYRSTWARTDTIVASRDPGRRHPRHRRRVARQPPVGAHAPARGDRASRRPRRHHPRADRRRSRPLTRLASRPFHQSVLASFRTGR